MDDDFFVIMADFITSSQQLAEAAKLCESDPIKQDMIKHIHQDFDDMCGRSEGIKLLIQKDYVVHRDFILEEMKEIIKQNHNMASEIKKKLEGLA